MSTPDKVLANLLKAGTHSNIQNILIRISDRELAICMLYLSEKDEIFLLSFLSSVKQNRIKQEQVYVKSLHLRYPQYRTVIDNVILRLQGLSRAGIRSYIRPRE